MSLRYSMICHSAVVLLGVAEAEQQRLNTVPDWENLRMAGGVSLSLLSQHAQGLLESVVDPGKAASGCATSPLT